MHKILAFVRRDGLIAASYRFNMLMSIASLLTLVVPLYFIAGALQPIVGDAIRSEGGQYFAFLVAGMATLQFLNVAVLALPSAVASGIRTGTFEVLLTTPTRLPTLFAGMLGYQFLWTVARAVALLLAAWMLGAEFAPDRLMLAVLIWAQITLSYVPIGLVCCALMMITRTAGPIPAAVLMVSMLLGGVYYPTHVVPSWLQSISDVVPLTYGLRALRRTLDPQTPLTQVLPDVGMLALITVAGLIASCIVFHYALMQARKAGTLSLY